MGAVHSFLTSEDSTSPPQHPSSNNLQRLMAANFSEIELLSLRHVFHLLKQNQENSISSSSESPAHQRLQLLHQSHPTKPVSGITESTFVDYLGFPADKKRVGQLFFRSFCNLSVYPDHSYSTNPPNLSVKDFIKPLALFCHKVNDDTLLGVKPLKVIFESFSDNITSSPIILPTTGNTHTKNSTPLDHQLDLEQTKTTQDSLHDLSSSTNFDWNPEDEDTVDKGPTVKPLDLVDVIDGILWLIQKIATSRDNAADTLPTHVSDSHLRHRATAIVEHIIQYSRVNSDALLPVDLSSEIIDFTMFSKYITRNAPNLFEVLSQYFHNLFLIGNTLNSSEAIVKNKFVLLGATPIPELNSPSNIITPENLALISWFLPLKKTNPTLTKLYSGSQHGFSMNQFELHICKYPAPTLLLLLVERQKIATPTMNRRQSIPFGNTALRHRHSISSNSPTYSTWGSDSRKSSFDKLTGRSPSTPLSTGNVLSTIFDKEPDSETTISTEPKEIPNSPSTVQRDSLDNTPAIVKPRRIEKERLILGAYVTETWKVSKSGWGNESFALFELSPCFEVFPAKKSSTSTSPQSSARSVPMRTGARGALTVSTTGVSTNQQNRHYIHFLKNAGVGFGGRESGSCMLFMDDNLQYGSYRQDFAGGNIYMDAGGARQSGFEIDFEIVECEVWGLGGPDAKARQQKEWDFEQREANRRASIHIRGKGGEQEVDMDLLMNKNEENEVDGGQHKHAPHEEEDPCKTLGGLEEPNIIFTNVKRCYENVPFNATQASNVFSTLYTLYRDYYIFLDLAMLDNHPKPFTTPSVDMLGGLDLLSRQKYHGDFEFHTAVEALINKLNDAHANYLADCYRHYLFVQPFELYAPVVNNVQTVRILADRSNRGLEECQILTIDGVNALDAIQSFADTSTGYSKDAGVRLNKALSGNYFDTNTMTWKLNSGLFTTRAILPERQTMVYHIKCPASQNFPEGSDSVVNADWEVFRLVSWNPFDSTESFLEQNCYRDTDPKEQARRSVTSETNSKPVRKHDWGVQAAIETPRHNTIRPLPKIQKRQYENDQIARLIFNGSTTAFYQLAKAPDVGVVVIPTHSVHVDSETSIMQEGFERLHSSGVRNIILDLTGNGGGYVNFAYDLVDWMFPVDNKTSVYQSDLRTSVSAKALAQADMEDDEYAGYYNPGSFSDVITNLDYDTNFFMQDRLIKRVQRRLGYTPVVYMHHNLGAFEMNMPWQHNAEKIVILTDGACGSACGMSINRLTNTHGVKSYAVGGRAGEDLSLFSFPGASVYGLDAILNDFEYLGVDSPMQQIRYKGMYRVPILEFYQEGETMPIEHNPKLFKASFHLDYTPITARRHEVLWEIVANNHWKQEGQTGDGPSIEKK
ncbi:hypothetical protein BGX27_007229 [Mortierella sp. AM989]|nr:hypothetical protein BGX27_007229 [Mortierella sp. AM989]